MLKIGSHLTAAKGFEHIGKDALSIGANTFQFFTRNPRGTRAKELNLPDVQALRTLLCKNNFAQVLAHAPYTLNACSVTPHLRDLAAQMCADDLSRMEHLPGNYYNFHPGSHLGQSIDSAVVFIADMLNCVLKPTQKTTVLLETMSGKGTEVGSRFEELKAILDRVELKDKMGVCFDACHLHDAGYDIVNDLDGVLRQFDSILGIDRLRAFHINDSMNPHGSHKDRHAQIGDGYIGLEAIVGIINHKYLRQLPFILETPTDLNGHTAEISLLKGLYRN